MAGPGRVRSEQARNAVLQATRDIVEEQGYAHLTIEKIAARAKVGKPTIYRWWQSKNAILAECVLAGDVLPLPDRETDAASIRVSAGRWYRSVLTYVDANAPLLRGLVAAAYEDSTFAEQLHSVLGGPIETALADWAHASGVANRPGQISARALAQLLYGAILVRLATIEEYQDDAREELFDHLISQFLGAEESN